MPKPAPSEAPVSTATTPSKAKAASTKPNAEPKVKPEKTGPVSLTKEKALAIQKDAELVKRGWQVEHILEQGASKPYIEALERAGVDYKIGPAIP